MENGEKDLPNKIQIFDNSKIRSVWDSENEKWYFAIVDVVAVLSESENPQAYWRKLKQRLKEEGNETVTNCHALKLPAADGKMRQTDVADAASLWKNAVVQSFLPKMQRKLELSSFHLKTIRKKIIVFR